MMTTDRFNRLTLFYLFLFSGETTPNIKVMLYVYLYNIGYPRFLKYTIGLSTFPGFHFSLSIP